MSRRTAVPCSRSAGALLLGFALATVPGAQEGKLEKVREAVRDDRGKEEHDDHDDDEFDDDEFDFLYDDSEDGPFDAFFLWCGENILLAPFTLPMRSLGDDGHSKVHFRDYPGADGEGYWIRAPEEGSHPRRWTTELRLEAGTDGDDLERFAGALRIEHASRLGLDLSASRWTEDLSTGGEDDLWLGDANLVYRFANDASTAFRAGLGLNWLADGGEEDYGFNFTYGLQWFLGPFEADFELDLGDLGEADFLHTRVALGYHLGRAALTLAYDDYDIGGVDLDCVSLGLAAWF